jgi:hypothetical protein
MELLLALPIVLAILLAIVQFALLLSARQQVTVAAREGARVAALGGSPADVRAVVDRFIGPSVGTVTARMTDEAGDPLPPGEPIEVAVRVPTRRMVPELLGMIGFALGDRDLVARAVMRKE